MYENENFDLYDIDMSFEHIGHEHIDEHDEHVYEQKCTKPVSIIDKDAFEKAVKKYLVELEEYTNTNWLMRLFKKRPVKPILSNFISY